MIVCNLCRQPIEQVNLGVIYGEIESRNNSIRLKINTQTFYHKGSCSRVAAQGWDRLHRSRWGWKNILAEDLVKDPVA